MMNINGSGHAADTRLTPGQSTSNLDLPHPTEASVSEEQKGLYEEVNQLRLEVERLRDQQQALQRTPESNDTYLDDEVKNQQSDDSNTKHPAGRRRVLHRRPVTLILALVVAAVLCVGSLRFWSYLQSYEWTDDAEVDGHLDPISTRIDGTVVQVYVENTYHVKAGQPLVDLDPRDYQVAVENAAANLAQAEQGVKLAQQNYDLSVANLAAAVATNTKAQLDVARYRELLDQQVIARETNDEIVMTGKVDVQAYGMTVFTPQYVQAFMGYDAKLAGMTQFPGASLLILLMPLSARLVRRIEARWLIGVGFLLNALAAFYVTTHIDLQIDFRTAATFRVLLAFGAAMLFVPINTASYVGVPAEKGGEVSGTINLLRNIGGSVGISMVETMIVRREQFHQDELVAHVTRARQSFRTATGGLSAHLFHRGLSQPQAMRQTTLRIYNSVITQATVLSYIDVAWLIGVLSLIMIPLAVMLRKNDPKAAPVSAE